MQAQGNRDLRRRDHGGLTFIELRDRSGLVQVVSVPEHQGAHQAMAASRNEYVLQVTGTVRWRESVLWMKEQGVTEMVELGAGKVLTGLVRRIDRDIATFNAETPAQIDELLTKLKG